MDALILRMTDDLPWERLPIDVRMALEVLLAVGWEFVPPRTPDDVGCPLCGLIGGHVRGIPDPGKNAVCEDCELIYPLDADGEPKTEAPYTCDDCGGAVAVARWTMAMKIRRLLCKVFGHRRWYFTPDDPPDDLWFGCARCKDPETVTDKIEWHDDPNRPGWGYVDPSGLERMKGRLDAP